MKTIIKGYSVKDKDYPDPEEVLIRDTFSRDDKVTVFFCTSYLAIWNMLTSSCLQVESFENKLIYFVAYRGFLKDLKLAEY